MAGQPHEPGRTGATGSAQALDRPPTPRWVTAVAIIAVIFLLAFIGLHLTGHSPAGLHTMPPGATMGPISPQP